MKKLQNGLYKKQKRQDFDHRAYYHDAPVLYIVQLPNEEGDMHIIYHLVHHDMPCYPNLVSSAFYTHSLSRLPFVIQC